MLARKEYPVLNKNSLWKVLCAIVVIGLCALYALPNIYGEDHAVQISAGRDATVTESMVEQVKSTLAEKNISVKRIEFADEQILVRVPDSDSQLVAREALESALGDDYFVAMNLAPDTPEWLEELGGTPMKLGLDLRGGVHFLMEVDMSEVITKSLEDAESGFRTSLREEGIRYRGVTQKDNHVDITFRDEEALDKAEFFLRNQNRDLTYTQVDDLVLRAVFSEAKLQEIRENAVKQNITIIRNRVNQLGVAEPLVQNKVRNELLCSCPVFKTPRGRKKF